MNGDVLSQAIEKVVSGSEGSRLCLHEEEIRVSDGEIVKRGRVGIPRRSDTHIEVVLRSVKRPGHDENRRHEARKRGHSPIRPT